MELETGKASLLDLFQAIGRLAVMFASIFHLLEHLNENLRLKFNSTILLLSNSCDRFKSDDLQSMQPHCKMAFRFNIGFLKLLCSARSDSWRFSS